GNRAGEPALAILSQPLGKAMVPADPDRHRLPSGGGASRECGSLLPFVLLAALPRTSPTHGLCDVGGLVLAKANKQFTANAAILVALPEEQAEFCISGPRVVASRIGLK